jgi:RNA polymerase II subunit A C-terminal domain phosphatase
MWTKSFGAEVTPDLHSKTTHVIANQKRRTTKVKKALRYPHIRIVSMEWLLDCFSKWRKVDEQPYLLYFEGDEPSRHADDGHLSPLEDLDGNLLSAEDENDTTTGTTPLTTGEEPRAIADDEWKGINDELEAFLEEEDTDEARSNPGTDDSGTESGETDGEDGEENSNAGKPVKRGHDLVDPSSGEESDSSNSSRSGSKLQRRKRRAMQRVTSLTNVVNAEQSASGLPSPETTGPEEDQEEAKRDRLAGRSSEALSEEDLEAEMLAELDNDSGDD